jgi:hypothetical protein
MTMIRLPRGFFAPHACACVFVIHLDKLPTAGEEAAQLLARFFSWDTRKK